MSEHHRHHHRSEEEEEGNYGGESGFEGQRPGYGHPESGYGNVPVAVESTDVYTTQHQLDDGRTAETQVTRHKREEVIGGLGALAATGLAAYEGYEVKADPENARRHRLEEEAAAGVGVGAAGLGVYGGYEAAQDKKGNRPEEGGEGEGKEKKHGWF